LNGALHTQIAAVGRAYRECCASFGRFSVDKRICINMWGRQKVRIFGREFVFRDLIKLCYAWHWLDGCARPLPEHETLTANWTAAAVTSAPRGSTLPASDLPKKYDVYGLIAP
jgi:hypothetical protein